MNSGPFGYWLDDYKCILSMYLPRVFVIKTNKNMKPGDLSLS